MATKFTAITAVFLLTTFFGITPSFADCGYDKGDWQTGEKIYQEGTCVACHGKKGRGKLPGVPKFSKKGGVLSKPHELISKYIKEGRSSGGPLSMPPKGGMPNLSDEDIEDVHAYLHHTFGCGR